MTEEAKQAKRAYHREYKSNMSDEARLAYNAHQRQYRKNNPDKVRKYNETYWERKASQASQVNEAGLNSQVIQLRNRGLSLREIGDYLGISHMTVSRILDKCNSE